MPSGSPHNEKAWHPRENQWGCPSLQSVYELRAEAEPETAAKRQLRLAPTN